MTDEIEWFVGFDWASEKHRACLLDRHGGVIGERDVPHGGAGLTELCDWLVDSAGAQPGAIAVAIEMPHGPVVEMLMERGFQLFAINPKQLDRFRDRFTVAGAKDDSRDARVLGDSLRTDRHAFRRLAVDDPVVIELREWSRMAEDLQQERTRLANRVREQLWRYYPQALQLTDDLAADWFLALWHQAPTPAKAAKLRKTTIERVLHAHRMLDELTARLEPAAESAPGQTSEQRDVAILRSLPGVGRINLATLLAEAWQPLRRRDYHALRALSGVAPVTRRSGKSCIVIRRLACNKRLERAVYHWARVATQHDPASRRRYADLRKRGHSHGRALRTVGDRLLAVACTLLQRQVVFDPDYNADPAQDDAAA